MILSAQGSQGNKKKARPTDNRNRYPQHGRSGNSYLYCCGYWVLNGRLRGLQEVSALGSVSRVFQKFLKDLKDVSKDFREFSGVSRVIIVWHGISEASHGFHEDRLILPDSVQETHCTSPKTPCNFPMNPPKALRKASWNLYETLLQCLKNVFRNLPRKLPWNRFSTPCTAISCPTLNVFFVNFELHETFNLLGHLRSSFAPCNLKFSEINKHPFSNLSYFE